MCISADHRQRQAEASLNKSGQGSVYATLLDGVAMFDEALHLAAWNRNFQRLLQASAAASCFQSAGQSRFGQ
jgi:hypothetical protein